MSRNVVLLVYDSARRDNCAEAMRRLTARAAVDVRCRTGAPWSVPAHGSLPTGTLPHEHGVSNDQPPGKTCLERLRGASRSLWRPGESDTVTDQSPPAFTDQFLDTPVGACGTAAGHEFDIQTQLENL